MIEFIDYEKRLTCEEHIVLLYYSLMYKKKHANYSEFQITELLIDEYNLDNNQEKRSEVEKMVERKKEDLDKFRVDYAQKIWDYEKPVIWSDRKKTDYYIEQLNKSHRFEVYVDYLFDSTDNIKEDRTPEDLLFQVMLDLGILLSSKIEEKTIAGKKVFNVADGFLIACFDNDVTEKTVKAVAQEKPYYAVFRDSSMANDSVATNFEQIFATYSPETVRKVL